MTANTFPDLLMGPHGYYFEKRTLRPARYTILRLLDSDTVYGMVKIEESGDVRITSKDFQLSGRWIGADGKTSFDAVAFKLHPLDRLNKETNQVKFTAHVISILADFGLETS